MAGLKANKLKALLTAQMILMAGSTIVSFFVLAFILFGGYGGLMLISSILMVLTHAAIIVYAVYGYRKKAMTYYFSIGFFMAAVLVNVMMNFRTPWQLGLLTLLFGLLFAYVVAKDDIKKRTLFILCAVFIVLVFSVYSAIIANPRSLGDTSVKTITVVAMYSSLFSPALVTGTFSLINSIHNV